MSKTGFAAVLAVLAATLLGAWLWIRETRYCLHKNEGATAFIIDRRTGKVWLSGAQEISGMAASEIGGFSEREQAITMAKNAYSLEEATTNQTLLETWLQNEKGLFRARGWDARKVQEGIYLVSYTIERLSGEPTFPQQGYWFEVQPNVNLVRMVVGDAALEEKYALRRIGPGEEKVREGQQGETETGVGLPDIDEILRRGREWEIKRRQEEIRKHEDGETK